MYRVEIAEKNRLVRVEVFEKLENAIYEGTHLGKGMLEFVDEKYHEKIEKTRPIAVILNDEFIFRWKCGVEVMIKKARALDEEAHSSHLLYEGKVI